MIRKGLTYGWLSAQRRAKEMMLPAVTTATGAFLVVIVFGMADGIRTQSAALGHADEIGRAVVLIAVTVFGVAEAIGTGTLQVYAMDLAPVDRRGAYLGVWSLYTNVGQITGPLLIGGLADLFSFTTAFVTVAVILSVSALLLAMLGKETAKREEEDNPWT